MASQAHLPDVTSPSLSLRHPTKIEQRCTWTQTHPQWGAALTLESYLSREEFLLTAPLSRNGGQTQWILTDSSLPSNERPVLATCETLRKRALVSSEDGTLKEVFAHGVASVFTYPQFRGKGYAGKMMELLGKTLAEQQAKNDGDAEFSILFSDIGKKFYAVVGWKPFESTHLDFPTKDSPDKMDETLKPITGADLADLAVQDEGILRKKMSSPSSSSKTRVALILDHETLLWHMVREDFMCKHIFNRTPTTRGVLYSPPDAPNSRVWAIWLRDFYGGVASPEKNTLYFLRFVVENEDMSDEALARAVNAIVRNGQDEAENWLCPKIRMWNPDERVKKIVDDMVDLDAKFAVRESDSITSLQWFGEGSVDDVEWIANEKFGWC